MDAQNVEVKFDRLGKAEVGFVFVNRGGTTSEDVLNEIYDYLRRENQIDAITAFPMTQTEHLSGAALIQELKDRRARAFEILEIASFKFRTEDAPWTICSR